MTRRLLASALILVVSAAVGCKRSSAAPKVSSTEREFTIEGVQFSQPFSLLFTTPEQQRIAYRNIDRLFPTRLVPKGDHVWALPSSPSEELADFSYTYQGRTLTVADFVSETNVAGLLVIKDGRIALEHYAHGHTATSKWTSMSVAKSVVSMLFGSALQDGSIKSLDDGVTAYVSALQGSAYEGVTVRQLLQMSSGVAWNEDYADLRSDVAQIASLSGVDALLDYMKRLPRKADPGTVFNYSTGETHIAGVVLRSATGRTLSEYLAEKIWQPAGMEADAYWRLLGPSDLEHGGCCLSATLRDYGRIGLLALRAGVVPNGAQLFPKSWMTVSTTPTSAVAPTGGTSTRPSGRGYGMFWWLDGTGGQFAARGVFGQYVWVDPANELVVVVHSLWPRARDLELAAHRTVFVEALSRYSASH
jgi:CubicO group peptidase (beta-lactamase class C family)